MWCQWYEPPTKNGEVTMTPGAPEDAVSRSAILAEPETAHVRLVQLAYHDKPAKRRFRRLP
jgi:hypothetical protein